MSDEADVFLATDFIAANQIGIEFELFGGGTVDDSFWAISAVPQGTNNEVEITRIRIQSDANGTRNLFFTINNNTSNDTNFTRGAIRLPTSD